MLLYGNNRNVITTNNSLVLNFSSLSESYPILNLLPPREFGNDYNYNFDLMYANWILNNDEPFLDFMIIVYNLYLGKDVFILVDDGLEQLNESLMKLIQQRYGYEAYRINCIEDFMLADNSSFSEFGLYNLDMDKSRFSYLAEERRIMEGGRPYGTDGI